ncbi:MAG: hypothetical protein DRI88_06610 [Bacteroidetes bacterium]|nr:MAG: hypothetical protein DRI88_06610 [Bacteroidota bacterium]HHL57945.1 hypothetical protein [Bacteroidota bacterium]
MKKVILLFLIAATVVSCKKTENSTPDVKKEADVSFNVTTIFPDAGREWEYDVPPCDPDAVPSFAKIKIDGVEGPDAGPGGSPSSGYFDIPVFWTNDNLYTQAIKLPVESEDECTEYMITEFYLYADGDNGPYMIKAAPLPDSPFYEFVENGLDLTFEVCAFEKIEIYIDVLCFVPDVYELFGFFWFEITEITVREMCFFGDVCIDWWLNEMDVPLWAWVEYENYYQNQMNGIQSDMPAIITLVLFKMVDGQYEQVKFWTNDNWDYPGEGEPLCIRYADYDNETDEFKLELYIYGPWFFNTNDVFGYTQGQPEHTWYFTDNADVLDLNEDGVVEFAWGDCVQDPEYHLPVIN